MAGTLLLTDDKLCQEGFMAKKLFFMLLVFGLIAGSTVASMATVGSVFNFNGALADVTLTGATIPGINIKDEQHIEEASEEEAYTYEKIIEEYDSLFFDKYIQTKNVYVKDIIIKQQDTRNASPQDYELSVTLDDSVVLENGDSIIIMAFTEKDGVFELLVAPNSVVIKYPKPYRFVLPLIGKKHPNHIRIIVFPKSSYDDITLEDNLQIEDREVVIPEPKQNFSIRNSLINSKQCFNILKKLGIR